jgi:hypothetical protein
MPTGLGKTSVMAIWLLALAEQARRGPEFVKLPRRLIWVVDRRVVVDQATRELSLFYRTSSDRNWPRTVPPSPVSLETRTILSSSALFAANGPTTACGVRTLPVPPSSSAPSI